MDVNRTLASANYWPLPSEPEPPVVVFEPMPGPALSGVAGESGVFMPPCRPGSLPCVRGSVPVAGGWLINGTPEPSVFMPGALLMAGARGDGTGSVGPVPAAVVDAAKTAGQSRALNTRAVNLDGIIGLLQ
jgi:hypothetical protein